MKNKFIIVSTIFTLTFSGFGYIGSANAQTDVSEKKEVVSEKLNDVETDILNASKQVNEINLDINSLESAVKVNQEEITRITKEAKSYELEVKVLEKEIITLEEEIEARNDILKERLSSYQNSGGDIGFMEVIFGSQGFEEFITRFTAVTTITKADNKLVEEQKNAINKVEEKEGQVKKKLIETEKTKKELTQINKDQKIQKNELTESKKSVESKVSDLEVKKSAYIAEGNDLEALEVQIEEEIRASEAGMSEDTETITSENVNSETVEVSEALPEEATSLRSTSNTQNNTETQTESQAPTQTQANEETQAPAQRESQAATQAETQTQTETQAPTQTQTETQAPTQTQAPTITNNKPKSKPKTETAPAKPSLSMGKGIIADAHSLKGTAYLYGSNGNLDSNGKPTNFDCSGFTTFVHKKNGINLPRSAQQQYNAFKHKMKKNSNQLRAGDLVFFSSSPGGGSITHVGISLGGSQYIGSQTSTGVATASLNGGYWGPRFVGGASPH